MTDDARRALESGPLADLRDPAPVLEHETVFEGKVWDIVRDRVRFGDGEIVREYMQHTGAVAILAIDDDDRVLLINQYRQPIGIREWEIPAGLLDVEGEEPLVAAKRELAEEADLEADEWSEPISFHTSPGGSDEVLYVYEARGLRATPAFDRTDEEAEIVLRWAPLDEVVAGVLEGRLHNGTMMVAVLSAAARRGRAAA
ncbi:NUDIX domain-containing protein [Pseudolysinimonas sp.]|uniref:NUDIX domain-containing protein n=1 Tax=Pseudolysinimonas sp. TaxID=2680009 RepID=UPI003F811DFB